MFLKIKKIPQVFWSSKKPLNLKPKISSLFFLCLGLIIFGFGEGLLIVSNSGASPWSVLAQGISLNVNLSIGLMTFIISITVLIFWIPLKQKPGIGTILNAFIIAIMIDLCIKFVPTPENYFYQIFLGIIAVLTVGLGGGIIFGSFSFILLSSLYGKEYIFNIFIGLKKNNEINKLMTIFLSLGIFYSFLPSISLSGHVAGILSGVIVFFL